jgi:hypothetical protein
MGLFGDQVQTFGDIAAVHGCPQVRLLAKSPLLEVNLSSSPHEPHGEPATSAARKAANVRDGSDSEVGATQSRLPLFPQQQTFLRPVVTSEKVPIGDPFRVVV